MATNKDDWDPPREASTFDTREGGGTKKDTAKFKTNVLQLLYCILKKTGTNMLSSSIGNARFLLIFLFKDILILVSNWFQIRDNCSPLYKNIDMESSTTNKCLSLFDTIY